MKDSGEKDLFLPKRLFATDRYPIGRLNVYCNANFLCSIRKALKNSKEWKQLVNSCFGELFAIPVNKLSVSGKLIHALLCRQVITKKKYEMWTVFGGQPLRFSMREFASVTGLPCHDFPEGYDPNIDTATEPVEGGYWNTLLGAGMEPNLDDVSQKMFETKDRLMKLRLALLLIVDGILIASHQKQRPTPKYVEMLADIDSFLAFPWGRESFLKTIGDMTPRKKEMGKQGNSSKALIKQLKQHTRRLVGFPIALQLLAYQNIPKLLSAMVDTSDIRSLIECRILEIPKQSSSIGDVHAVEQAENLVVVPLIDEVEDEDEMVNCVDFEDENNDRKVDYLLEKIGTRHQFIKSEWPGGNIGLPTIGEAKKISASKVVKLVLSGKRKEVAESALAPKKKTLKRKRKEVTENISDNDTNLPVDVDDRLAALEKDLDFVKSENAKLEERVSTIETHLKTFRLRRKRKCTFRNTLEVNKKKSCGRGLVKVRRKSANSIHISHKTSIQSSRELLGDSVGKFFIHLEETVVEKVLAESEDNNCELKRHSSEGLVIDAGTNQIGAEDVEKTETTEEIKENEVFNEMEVQDASNEELIREENMGDRLDGLTMDIDLNKLADMNVEYTVDNDEKGNSDEMVSYMGLGKSGEVSMYISENKVEDVITQDAKEISEEKKVYDDSILSHKEFYKDGEMPIDVDAKQETNSISSATKKMRNEDGKADSERSVLAIKVKNERISRNCHSRTDKNTSEVERKYDEGFMEVLSMDLVYDTEIKRDYDLHQIESLSLDYSGHGVPTNREEFVEEMVSDEEESPNTEHIELSDSSPAKIKEKSYLSAAEKNLVDMFARSKGDELTMHILDVQSNFVGQVDENQFQLWKQTLMQSPETLHDTNWGYEFDNNFLLELSQAKQWVSHLHIEVLGSLVTRMYSTTLSTERLAFVSPWFANSLQGKYKTFSRARNKKKFRWTELIKKSVTSEESQWFANVDTVYMPMIWDDSHWVGIVIHLRNWTVQILDPNTDLYGDRKVKKFIAPVVEMLPYIIDKFCTAHASQANDLRPFVWDRVKTIYKNIRSGDCGPVSMKFLEIHCNGGSALDLARITDRMVDTFRKQYALDIYKAMVVPLYASD